MGDDSRARAQREEHGIARKYDRDARGGRERWDDGRENRAQREGGEYRAHWQNKCATKQEQAWDTRSGRNYSNQDDSNAGSIHEEVKAYIEEHELDSVAAEALLACAVDIQRKVMNRGIARKMSPVVMARIKEAKMELKSGSASVASAAWMNEQDSRKRNREEDEYDSARNNHRSEEPLARRRVVPQLKSNFDALIDAEIDAAASKASASEGQAVQLRSARHVQMADDVRDASDDAAEAISKWHVEDGEVQRYIDEHSLDSRAAAALLGSPEYVQRKVMDRGIARNMSPVVMARIREAKNALKKYC